MTFIWRFKNILLRWSQCIMYRTVMPMRGQGSEIQIDLVI